MTEAETYVTTRPVYPDVCTRHTMVPTATRWGSLGGLSAEVAEALSASTYVVLAHSVEFFVDAQGWGALFRQQVAMTRCAVTAVGRSTVDLERCFAQVTGVAGGGAAPLVTLASTLAAVDDSMGRAVPLPRAEVLRAARVPAACTAAWRHERLRGRPASPPPFCLRLVARRTEMDALRHVNNSVYAVWMEEARAEAHAAGAYEHDVSLGMPAADAPPRRARLEFRGQAVAGDRVQVFTWWDGEAFGFEVAREGGKEETLALGRIWTEPAEPPAAKL